MGDAEIDSERSIFGGYFEKLIDLDASNRIYDVIWARFPHAIRGLLGNQFVFQPFWRHQNQASGYADWEDRFERSKRAVAAALASRNTKVVLSTLFDRLYVLCNQLVHGGATWNGGVNRSQVRDGARIVALLVPIFIDIVMDNAGTDWGVPYYPVVD